ncbi:ABC transporter substrate-binding protein [Rhodophyticola sp. CCM32]|nr:ABC transporter substrate-binding protein [Rhodophyticola sp. CCM32]
MTDAAWTRRRFGVLGLATGLAALAPAHMALALNLTEARSLIDRAVAELTQIINSGQSEAAMLRDFERFFARHADVPTIARSVLGAPARSASNAQLRAFTAAFQHYMANKYGRRFREFIGGEIQVIDGRQVNRYFEIISSVRLRNQSPFEVRWMVSDRSGQNRFFDMIIEGVSLGITERAEIGGMLDRRGGDLDALIAHLQSIG